MKVGKWVCLVGMALALACPGAVNAQKPFRSGRAAFSIQCNDLIMGYEEQAVFVMPGEVLHLKVVDADWRAIYQFESADGESHSMGDRSWAWTVPERPGQYDAHLTRLERQEAVLIHCFVMVPFDRLQDGVLNGYVIGDYPQNGNGNVEGYPKPKGFIEVTEETIDCKLTPHFTLRQFVCHQDGGFPKYVVLDERLLIKLEVVLARVHLEGFACRTLSVSSGYRTPYYNRRLGKKYSLHMWGRAADVFVDGNGDNRMDDLNRDGRNNMADVRRLMTVVEQIEDEPRHYDKIGGVGLYDRTEKHGPFVHIDVRGERARWETKK